MSKFLPFPEPKFVSEQEKINTGFLCSREPIYTGDILSLNFGYDGLVRVVKRESGYWLVDVNKGRPHIAPKYIMPDEPLEHDLQFPYSKTEPDDPYTSISPVICEHCLEEVIGHLCVEDNEVEWNDKMGKNWVDCRGSHAVCKACVEDPSRRTRTMELHEYLERKVQESGLNDFHVIVHEPVFESETQIDTWVEHMRALRAYIETFFQ